MYRVLALFIGVVLCSRAFAVEQRLPDIVVYLADDLSASDLPIYGGSNIRDTGNRRAGC